MSRHRSADSASLIATVDGVRVMWRPVAGEGGGVLTTSKAMEKKLSTVFEERRLVPWHGMLVHAEPSTAVGVLMALHAVCGRQLLIEHQPAEIDDWVADFQHKSGYPIDPSKTVVGPSEGGYGRRVALL